MSLRPSTPIAPSCIRIFESVKPNANFKRIELHIGEPKHPTPQFIKDELIAALGGLAQYPATAGAISLREAIAGWLSKRYALHSIDPTTQVLPINGSREALFAIAQVVLNPIAGGAPPLVISPNPF